jgi:hypothetical protein
VEVTEARIGCGEVARVGVYFRGTSVGQGGRQKD